MNAIGAHRKDLQELLDDLSGYEVVSGITFVALVNAYITRIDTESELTYGPKIDSKLRALLRVTQNFRTTRGVLPKNSHCGPQTSAGCLFATAAGRTLHAPVLLPGQRTLIDVKQQVKHEDGSKKIKSECRSSTQKRSATHSFRGKPKYLFHGTVK